MRIVAAFLLLAGLGLAVAPRFAFTADTTPAAHKYLACCGAKCKTMPNCCTVDAKGNVTCSMNGSCCNK